MKEEIQIHHPLYHLTVELEKTMAGEKTEVPLAMELIDAAKEHPEKVRLLKHMMRTRYGREGIGPFDKQKNEKVIYVCSKYKGNVKKNTKKTIEYCRMVYQLGHIPIAPHLYIPRWLDDNNPEEREQGLKLGLRALRHCDEIWVFGDFISEGMLQEIEFAEANNIPIRHFCGEV